jgi:ketosteroid isomerase-like protein
MLEQAADPMLAVVTRLRDAMNEHDLEALVDVFDPDFVSETPAHPQRTVRGADEVRRNWEQIFAGVPDLQADLLDAVVDRDTVWSEWDWHGTRRDGAPHRMDSRDMTADTTDRARRFPDIPSTPLREVSARQLRPAPGRSIGRPPVTQP